MAKGRSGSAPANAPKVPEAGASSLQGHPQDQMPTIRLLSHQDPRSNRPSLAFPATSRTLPHEDCVIRVGRYSERDINPHPPPNTPSSAPIGFKSKVVSRRHCEFWCSQGQWYIKDVKSSSGTFLNHIRLSAPSLESRPWPVNDGDLVQLGIDFRGGEEMIFRCVKIRVECNRAWQKTLNNYNVTTHKRLRDLNKTALKNDSDTASSHSSECSICLMSIAPCQSLFVAPCSHVWHYKCIKTMLTSNIYPQFHCPNCRAVTDLEADVDEPILDEDWEEEDIAVGSGPENGISQISSTDATNGDSVSEQRAASVNQDNDTLSDAARVLQDTHLAPSLATASAPTNGSSSSPHLIDRRSASRPSPAYPRNSEDSVTRTAPIPIAPVQYLRPITPTQPLMINGELDEARSHTPMTEMLVTDGPMTPTNNAGPFVFDGSAGRAERAEGRIGAASMADTTMTEA